VDVSDLYTLEGEEAVVLGVHLDPGAGGSAVVGRHGQSLKMRVAAAPEGGRANDAAAALLADTFGVSTSAVELVSGAGSRAKRFRLSGVDVDDFRRRLERLVSEGATGQGPVSNVRGGKSRPA
jgi:uncharacterized protein (TIGR00251 family)